MEGGTPRAVQGEPGEYECVKVHERSDGTRTEEFLNDFTYDGRD